MIGSPALRPAPLGAAPRRAARLTAALALSVYMATASGSLNSTDAVMIYEVTKSLVWRGSFAVSYDVIEDYPSRGTDGRYYSPFGIGQSIVNVPFYLTGRLLAGGLGLRIGRPDTLEKAVVALGNAFVSAAVVHLAFLFAWRLGGSLTAAAWTGLSLAFATLLWPYARFGFNVPLATWCLLAGTYGVWLGVRQDDRVTLALGGMALGGAILTRHEMSVAAMVAAAWIAFETRHDRRRIGTRLTWFGVPAGAALAFWLWFNWWRFGHPLNAGTWGDPSMSLGWPLAGIAGLLFSPGRSIFIYVPLAAAGVAALAALARRDRSLAALFAALMAALLTVYGALPSWDGKMSYGPRYLVPLMPLVVIPLVWWFRPASGQWRPALLALVAASALVQLPGVLVDFSKVSIAHAHAVGGYSRESRVYTWPESGLALNSAALAAAAPENVRYVVTGHRPPVADRPAGMNFSQQFAFSLDLWWLYLYYMGVLSSAAALLAGAAPLAAAFFIGRRLRRMIRDDEGGEGREHA